MRPCRLFRGIHAADGPALPWPPDSGPLVGARKDLSEVAICQLSKGDGRRAGGAESRPWVSQGGWRGTAARLGERPARCAGPVRAAKRNETAARRKDTTSSGGRSTPSLTGGGSYRSRAHRSRHPRKRKKNLKKSGTEVPPLALLPIATGLRNRNAPTRCTDAAGHRSPAANPPQECCSRWCGIPCRSGCCPAARSSRHRWRARSRRH
ncbi:hypothetical protein SAMN06296416_106114 [Pseudoxanthomonas wuyuanensis]|uniref:Uncharacterized protein n=1 Tax=Pseudoxanthomonas wuyuanensis TaxID=1073196 RepID=A0A286D919_9GAMM|nr:hypothetical protein SAMN06296416_106114 [Pseudoxanthomonas wuyuanensis]